MPQIDPIISAELQNLPGQQEEIFAAVITGDEHFRLMFADGFRRAQDGVLLLPFHVHFDIADGGALHQGIHALHMGDASLGGHGGVAAGICGEGQFAGLFPDACVDAADAGEVFGVISSCPYGLKVLSNGTLTKKVTVKAAAFSASAKEKIEQAGGKAEVV